MFGLSITTLVGLLGGVSWLIPGATGTAVAGALPLLEEAAPVLDLALPALEKAFQIATPAVKNIFAAINHHVAQGMTHEEAGAHVASVVASMGKQTPDAFQRAVDFQAGGGN